MNSRLTEFITVLTQEIQNDTLFPPDNISPDIMSRLGSLMPNGKPYQTGSSAFIYALHEWHEITNGPVIGKIEILITLPTHPSNFGFMLKTYCKKLDDSTFEFKDIAISVNEVNIELSKEDKNLAGKLMVAAGNRIQMRTV
jgi:hypothetical protein